MDSHGRSFAESLFNLHSEVIKGVANIKNFELKPLTALLNSFTEKAREMMTGVFQQLRQADDGYTQQVYQTARMAFSRNLRTALEARESWYKDKLRASRTKHEQQLHAVRAAAGVEVKQAVTQMRIAVARVLAKNPEARVDMATASAAMRALGTDVSPSAARSADAEASMLEELFQDATAADALNTQLREQLESARKLAQDLSHRVEEANARVTAAEHEALEWKSKWAVEATKTDSIKREAMVIISQCEAHVTKLQQQHIAELTQRDYALTRAKDAITALEVKLTALEAEKHPAGTDTGEADKSSHTLRWKRVPLEVGVSTSSASVNASRHSGDNSN